MHCDDAMCAAANETLLVWSCNVEAQRLPCGGSTNVLPMLGCASSPAAAVAVSGGFSGSISGRGGGLVNGSHRQDGPW